MRYIKRNYFDYRIQGSLRWKLRLKRMRPLLRMIERQYALHGCVKIIDVGGTQHYWNLVPEKILLENNVTITIVNVPGCSYPSNNGIFSFVQMDGCDLSAFRDKTFHIAHSNSVIEHVGDWGRMKQFASELRRVADAYFVQTPSFWFPIEPHCMTPLFHWLPKPWRVSLVLHFDLGHWEKQQNVDKAVEMVESARLLDKRMVASLLSDSCITTERFLLLPKSYVAIKE